jgi:hypothetical protein
MLRLILHSETPGRWLQENTAKRPQHTTTDDHSVTWHRRLSNKQPACTTSAKQHTSIHHAQALLGTVTPHYQSKPSNNPRPFVADVSWMDHWRDLMVDNPNASDICKERHHVMQYNAATSDAETSGPHLGRVQRAGHILLVSKHQ